MGKLTPSKELRTVYKVLKRIHAAEQLDETDPGMFAPEVFDIDAAQRDRIMAMLQAEGLIDGVIVRKYVGQRRETVLIDWQALEGVPRIRGDDPWRMGRDSNPRSHAGSPG